MTAGVSLAKLPIGKEKKIPFFPASMTFQSCQRVAMGAVSVLMSRTPRSMPTFPPKPIIFISYACADEPKEPPAGEVKWLSFVTGYLRPAEEIGAFEIWTEPLAPDADLDPEIQRKLRACDMFVPLFSPHSLAFGAVVGRQIAIIRERQARGEGVHLYPLLLAPTAAAALNLVRPDNLGPLGVRPFSSYADEDRDRHMLDAADEIVAIAADAAALKTTRRSRSPPSPLLPASPGSLQRTARRPARETKTDEQESLEGWLTKQIPQVAAAIAARAALRVAACRGRGVPKGSNAKGASRFLASTSAILRASALARVAAKYPNHANELRAAALVATEHAAAEHISDALALSAAAYAAAVADMVAQDSAFAAPLATPFDGPAPFAAAYSAAAATADPAVRMEIRFDASALQRLGARQLAELPLWRQSLPDWWKKNWESLKTALPRDEDWDVWIEWYEERLLGGSRGETYELVFASAPQEVWDRGPSAANAWIKAHLPPDSGGTSLPDRHTSLPRPV